jgi:hypothetical protein
MAIVDKEAMNENKAAVSRMRSIFLFTLFIALSACASDTQVVNHSFGFDAISDSPDIELLDYRYGDSELPGASNPDRLRNKGIAPPRTSISGPMRRGDSLYVKWRIRNTGQVYEDTVDLRNRLPTNIKDHKVYFLIKGTQLFVYLIPPESEKRSRAMSANGPRMYSDLNVITIYPKESKR